MSLRAVEDHDSPTKTIHYLINTSWEIRACADREFRHHPA